MQVCGLEWSPDNRYLASGANDNLLCVWDANLGHETQPLHTFNQHQAAVKVCRTEWKKSFKISSLVKNLWVLLRRRWLGLRGTRAFSRAEAELPIVTSVSGTWRQAHASTASTRILRCATNTQLHMHVKWSLSKHALFLLLRCRALHGRKITTKSSQATVTLNTSWRCGSIHKWRRSPTCTATQLAPCVCKISNYYVSYDLASLRLVSGANPLHGRLPRWRHRSKRCRRWNTPLVEVLAGWQADESQCCQD